MKQLHLIVVLLASFLSSAQSIQRQVIASGGMQYSNANGSGSATTGQIDYLTIGQSTILTQGFQQPSSTVLIVNETSIEIGFPACLSSESMATLSLNNQICEGESPLVLINGVEIPEPYEVEMAPSILVFLDYPNDACDVEINLNTEPGNEVQACAFFIPNLITPNGDGQNDLWSIQNPIESGYELKVLSRWGNEVFSDDTFTHDKSWDGNDKNGNSLPSGVYFYVLIGEEEIYKGTINLLK